MRGVEATKDGTFRARIRHQGRLIQLGCFTSQEQAAAAYQFARGRKDAGLHPVPPVEYGPKTEIESLRERYHYDPLTGAFTYKAGAFAAAGREAGGVCNHGYTTVVLGRKRYQAHRVAWALMTGRWPEADIDHINRIKTDNRFENLREASRAQNLANCAVRGDSRSGLKGAILRHGSHKRRLKYTARIVVGGVRHMLGNFETAEQAHAAYVEAASKFYGDFASA